MAALRAKRIVKRFEGTIALDGVDLSIEPGEVRGLLGPNGAGKTTLLRVLLGLVRPDAGSVQLFDHPPEEGHRPAFGAVAGFVETPAFYPYLSGRVNLELLARLDGALDRAAIESVLDRVGLRARSRERTNGYSSGMRQRLAIAACLLQAPRLLLLDEPTSGLDPQGVRDVLALVGDLSAEGVAVLISSHQMREVQDLCHTFTFLRQGAVVWDGSAAALRAQAHGSPYRLVTSDDRRALDVARACPGIRARWDGHGDLLVTSQDGTLDSYVLQLGRAGVAVRALEQRVNPVEALFFELTGAVNPELAAEDAVEPVAATP